MSVMNVWLMNRLGKVIGYSETVSYEIAPDYLTNRQSHFVLQKSINVQPNQYIVAKDNDGTQPAFFGVVSSLENDTINANNILQLLNFEVILEKNLSGESVEALLSNIISTRFMFDFTKKTMPITMLAKTKTPYYISLSDQDEKYVSYNLASLLMMIFQKYGVVWQFDDITFSGDGNVYTMNTSIVSYGDDKISIKDNSYYFVNWDVYDRPIGPALENKAIVYDTSSNLPITSADIFYLRSDNTLTQDYNDNVYLPTKDKVVLYDKSQEKSTPQELAASALLGNAYSHEINFDLKPKSGIIDEKTFFIGMKFNIIYKDSLYQSMLTGYKITNSSNFITLTFGNYRSDFNQVIKNISRR